MTRPYVGAAINGAFVGQRVTGQQRYATEISGALRREWSYRLIDPPPSSDGRLAWAWAQTVLPVKAGREPLLSLTARAPILHPRQAVAVHDLFPLTNPEWYSQRYLRVARPLLLHHLQAARLIIAVSEPAALDIRERTRRPVVVAPNAVADVFWQQPAQSEESRASSPYVMSVGSADPRKNFDRLAEAYAASGLRAAGVKLVIVGGSSGHFAGTTRRDVEGVYHMGYVSDDKLRSLYANSMGVILPSLAEGFGLPLIEAMAAGAPRIAASDLAVFRWIAGDRAHYFDPASIRDMAAALTHLVQTREAPLTAQQAASELASRFSWSGSAREIHEAIIRYLL